MFSNTYDIFLKIFTLVSFILSLLNNVLINAADNNMIMYTCLMDCILYL